MLVGQPNLREKLGATDLEQLRQRITVSYHLMPLDAEETANYVNHRLRRAAIGAPLEFPRDATDAIHARSRGVPRIINVICDAALVFGYAEERRTIDLPLVQEVLAELELTGVLPPPGATNVVESAPVVTAAPAAVGGAAAVAAPAAPAAVRQQRTPDSRIEASLLHDLTARAAELDQREQAVRQRERELAEQRRILAEEYRLLRSRTASGSHPYTPPDTLRVQVQSPLRAHAERSGSLWQRVKRAVGASSPAME